MDSLPHKDSLVSQTVEVIIRRLSAGVWKEWLPNERALCEILHVSRNTLRAALARLARRGIVKPIRPIGTKILVQSPASPAPKNHTIGLLSPQPLNRLRPGVVLIMDELREQLGEAGYLLRAHHGERFFAPDPGSALQKLVRANPHDCWLLVLSSADMKQWFLSSKTNCVVSGTSTDGARLPFVDVDFRALYRHAVGQLVAAGHRRIALLLEQSSTGGDLEAEIGFNEGIRQSRHPDADGRVFRYQPSILPLARILDRLFNAARPPSALLLGNPNFYLFAHTYLQSRGLRIPRDVSLLSCNDDPFLSFVHPSPDRYVFNTHLFAKKLFNLLMRVIDGTASEQPAVRIMPDFHKGATLAPPANETQSRAKG